MERASSICALFEGGRSKLNADRHLTWPPMSDSRHKLRNARPIVATNRETKTFAVKYA
jgi:hypothetical protein